MLVDLRTCAFASAITLFSFGTLAQCPSANSTLFSNQTISSNCTVSGNLTIQGPTLTIDPGVTLIVTGNLTIQGDAVISASSTSVINIGGNLVDVWVGGTGKNVVSGGTYNITGDIRETSGSGFEINNAIMYADSMATGGGSTVEILNGSEVYLARGMRSEEILNIDASKLDVGGDLVVTGGDAVTVSNSGELIVRGDYSFNGTGGGGTLLSVETGGLVRVFGDVDSSTDSNSINVDDNSGISVGGAFIGSTPPTVNVGAGDEGTACTSGGCCGDASACGEAIVLPVSLINFNHTLTDGSVSLRWSTASELNNDYFTLERSIDGINFSRICEIPGGGTVNEVQKYSHIDQVNVFADRMYYRLSQTDFDGSHEVLGIISLSNESFQNPLKVYPNPVVNTGSIVLSGISLDAQWQVYSLSGELVRSGQVDDGGKTSVEGLKAGTYILKVNMGNTRSCLLIIK